MIISHIVAMSENRIIGRDGGMPWHIPEDFKFFKATTMGHAMIMGRKTWESIGRPLPGRLSIVISRQTLSDLPENVIHCRSTDDALAHCEQSQEKWGEECFIVGGGEIYRQTLKNTNKIYLTIVHKVINGDTTYPEISLDDFRQVKSEAHLSASLPFTFTTWQRLATKPD
jgi:dihydrofolate reductase